MKASPDTGSFFQFLFFYLERYTLISQKIFSLFSILEMHLSFEYCFLFTSSTNMEKNNMEKRRKTFNPKGEQVLNLGNS